MFTRTLPGKKGKGIYLIKEEGGRRDACSYLTPSLPSPLSPLPSPLPYYPLYLHPHPLHHPLPSAADFQNVLCKLRREASQLTLETTYAEMAVTSIDKIKQVMSEKWQVELELKRSYSEPRRRWVSAINRVLIQNYIGKVKVRIAEVEKVQKEREEAFLEASPRYV